MSADSKSRGTVLLIDDDEDMITIGGSVFGKAGLSMMSAGDGAEGLRKICEFEPDVVLLDFNLPDQKGSELIETVATVDEYAKYRSIPFVILTAWEENLVDLVKLYRFGLKAYLSKPFGHRELRCIIENIIQERRSNAARAANPGPDSECQDLARSIVGLSGSLLDNLNGELSEQQATDLEAIHNCGRRLIRLFEG
jgi:DNA-binding response OmpR family regulator